MDATALAAWTTATVVGALVVAATVLRRPLGPEDTGSGRWLDIHSWEHVVWGMVSYALLSLTPWSAGTRLLAAATISAAWEVWENSPWGIRLMVTKTASTGYRGDTMVNMATDMACVLLGFGVAHLLPWQINLMGAVAIQLTAIPGTPENALRTAAGLLG